MQWNVVRIAYFTSDKSELIRLGVAPVLAEIEERFRIERAYIRAHWKFGPHVDIAIECDRQHFESEIFPFAQMALEAWVGEHPSKETIDLEGYVELSKQLALYELEAGPYEPLLANNSVTRGTYSDATAVLGSASMVRARDSFLASTTPIVLDLVECKAKAPEEFMLRLGAMFVLAGTLYPRQGLYLGHMSYRSHVEYFFANHDPSGVAKGRFDEFDRQLGDAFDDIVRRVVEVRPPSEYAFAFPNLTNWIRVLEGTNEEVTRAYDAEPDPFTRIDRLGALTDEIIDGTGAVLDPANDRKASEFERNAPNLQELFLSRHFVIYRTSINFLYALLPVLSVTPMQKYLLCYLVANACERVYGTTWRDIHARSREAIQVGGGK